MKKLDLSYTTAQMANQLIDCLPSTPRWKTVPISIDGFPTREPLVLYYRDAQACVEHILSNPLFADCMNFIPVKHYDSQGNRFNDEPLSAQQAWDTQV